MTDQPDVNDSRVFREDGSVAYDSIEEMFAAMERAEREANERATPTQRAITFGDYVVRPMSDAGVIVFGLIWPKDLRDADENPATIARLDASHERGYRTGKWSSDFVPEGEIGDAHIATLWPITREEYELAERLDFVTWRVATDPVGREMIRRVLHDAREEMGATYSEDGAGFVVAEEDPT